MSDSCVASDDAELCMEQRLLCELDGVRFETDSPRYRPRRLGESMGAGRLRRVPARGCFESKSEADHGKLSQGEVTAGEVAWELGVDVHSWSANLQASEQ